MAVIEKTFAIDEKIAKQFDDLFSYDEQASYVNQSIAKQVYKIKKTNLLQTMQELQNATQKIDGISTTDMIYRFRNGEEL